MKKEVLISAIKACCYFGGMYYALSIVANRIENGHKKIKQKKENLNKIKKGRKYAR